MFGHDVMRSRNFSKKTGKEDTVVVAFAFGWRKMGSKEGKPLLMSFDWSCFAYPSLFMSIQHQIEKIHYRWFQIFSMFIPVSGNDPI